MYIYRRSATLSRAFLTKIVIPRPRNLFSPTYSDSCLACLDNNTSTILPQNTNNYAPHPIYSYRVFTRCPSPKTYSHLARSPDPTSSAQYGFESSNGAKLQIRPLRLSHHGARATVRTSRPHHERARCGSPCASRLSRASRIPRAIRHTDHVAVPESAKVQRGACQEDVSPIDTAAKTYDC